MKAKLFGLIACLALLGGVSRAYAATVILTDPAHAIAIDNLVIDNVTYDVTFNIFNTGNGDATFFGNPTGALDAVTAIDAALNASTAINVTGAGYASAGYFLVQILLDTGAVGYETGSGWALYSPITQFGPGVVDATFATTPLPAALPLFAGGLGAMGLFGWRRKRKNAAAIAA